ncbi:unnamed protein product [Effrenium voratum]|nr:unnamed protein product [Effrenium voratum]
MRCGPMVAASPRKSVQPPIGSPRLARSVATKDGGARLSAIGRMALRDKPSQQQHSAALYGVQSGARLWPKFMDQVCERPPLAPQKETRTDSPRPQSARGGAAQRSTSAPRCPGRSAAREGPQRTASSIDCSERGTSSAPQSRSVTRNILGTHGPPSSYAPSGGAAMEDLGYTKMDLISGQTLAQTVESLLQGKLSGGPLHREVSVPTIDDLVVYTEPDVDQKPGLGSVQPKGRAEVMQQWLREPQGARLERRETAKLLPLKSSAQAPESTELEWSSLSDTSKQAIRQWVAGQLGGRHCMLVLEQGCAETALPSIDTSMLPDLRGGAVLNVLSGLFAEGGLLNPQGSGSWLFQAVFCKHPQQVLEEALEQCIVEIGDPRLERISEVSPEQANLALRRRLLKAQFASLSPGQEEQEESTKLQAAGGWWGFCWSAPSSARGPRYAQPGAEIRLSAGSRNKPKMDFR